MIRINRDNLPQISQKFSSYLNDWFVDKRNNQNKLDKWILEAQDNGNLGLGNMLGFYMENKNSIDQINSAGKLKEINKKFYCSFQNEIREWNVKSSKQEKSETQFGLFIKKMEYVYTGFIKADKLIPRSKDSVGQWLSKALNVKTCPYCNRHYTFTIDQTKYHGAIRPQFDHFLPKSRYPITAVCFYNIVPACPECNKVKGERLISIHPYEDSFESNGMSFHVKYPYNNKSNLTITNSKNHKNVSRLALQELYQEHKDFVEDIISKAEAYNKNYYDNLVFNFKGLGLSQDDMDRLIWGTSLDEDKYSLRPLSKLTKDIFNQLQIHRI